MELPAKHRVHAVRGDDDQPALRGEGFAGPRAHEVRNRAAGVCLRPHALPAEVQPVRADSFPNGRRKHRLQIPAVDRVLRPIVARVPSHRLAIDELTEAVEERRLPGEDRHARERRLQPQLAERLRCVREDIDADPERPDLRGGLVDATSEPGAMQHQPERQAADAGADDEDVHA